MKSELRMATKVTTHNAIQKWSRRLPIRTRRRVCPGEADLNNFSDQNLSQAVLGFNTEAVLYCDGISDTIAKDYAVEYARMIQQRATGNKIEFPRIPAGLFGPNCSLIRSKLEAISKKYFPPK
jgi:hypothetical protein